MKEIPKINKVYNCFGDGKINKSRLKDTLEQWKDEVKQYAKETDYFIKTWNGEFEESKIWI